MKNYLAIFLLLILAVTASTVRSQETKTSAPATSAPETTETAPPMTENDRIPFLANQNTATASPDQSNGSLIVKMIGSLAVVIGLLFGGVWAVKRFAPGILPRTAAVDAQLALVESITIGPGRTIATVRFGERLLLVGATAQSMILLAEDDAPRPMTRSVAELLDAENDFGTVYARASQMLADDSDAEGGRS